MSLSPISRCRRRCIPLFDVAQGAEGDEGDEGDDAKGKTPYVKDCKKPTPKVRLEGISN
jgi:hypothetical protein